LLLPVEIGTAPGHETGKSRTAVSPKLCSENQECRFLLLQCHTTLFAAIKDPWRRKRGFCLWGLYFGLFAFDYWEETFTLGLLVWEAFGREKNYRRENAKEGLIESLH
jgi:hypothetical protein